MSVTSLLLLLLIASICGGIGQSLAGYSFGGCIVSIFIGFAGAWIGMWIAGEFGLPEWLTINVGGRPFPVVWSVIGSFLFSVVVGGITRGSKKD